MFSIPHRIPSRFKSENKPLTPLQHHPLTITSQIKQGFGEKINKIIVSGVSTRFYVKPLRNIADEKLAKRNKYLHISEVTQTFGVKGSTKSTNDEKVIEKKPGNGDPNNVVMKVTNLSKNLPNGRILFEDVSLSFFHGSKIGILGMNGAGKSTFMKVLAGLDDEFEGDVDFFKGARVGYLAQEPMLDETKTVRENILSGVSHLIEPLIKYYDICDLLENDNLSLVERSLLEERVKSLSKIIQDQKLREFQWQVERAISALKCPPPESSVHYLSGGERRRVALARLLIARPDVLLLDEPTNHLDAASVAWLEYFLAQYKGMVLAITHDRYFLDNVAGWILEIEGGHCHPFEGNYSQWLVAKRDRLELEKRKQMVLEKQVKAELEWVRQCPKGRQAKSKARLDRFDKLQLQLQTKIYEPGVIVIPPGPKLGKEVISVQSLTKTIFNPGTEVRKLLFQNLSFKLERGGIVGIIGPNGSGKTTLLKILGGLETPDSGEIKIGQTVKMGYACQSRNLDPNNTVYQEISEGIHEITIGDKLISLRKYVACFNFKSGQQDRMIRDLSGGERNRVHLAKMLKSNVNVILLDEPTNDIDIEVLRSLEEGIQEYPGCILVVSHDRWFLDRVATHILAFEENGDYVFFEGNYSEYESKRGSDKDVKIFANITKRGVW